MAKNNRVSEVFGQPKFTAVNRPAKTSPRNGGKYRVLASVVIPVKAIDSKVIEGLTGQILARQPKGASHATAAFGWTGAYGQSGLAVPSTSAAEMAEYEKGVMTAYLAWVKETGNAPAEVPESDGVKLDISL